MWVVFLLYVMHVACAFIVLCVLLSCARVLAPGMCVYCEERVGRIYLLYVFVCVVVKRVGVVVLCACSCVCVRVLPCVSAVFDTLSVVRFASVLASCASLPWRGALHL